MRRAHGDSPPARNTLQTITAAADAIAAVDHHFPRATAVQKRRWSSCWSIYWCFGSLKHRKRIGPAVLFPEPTPTTQSPANSLQSPDNVLPFAAPPSSPASFLPSEPPSATQSPTAAILSFTSFSASMDGPSSIFAIGPFAHETQLVSPPLNFSTLTTEPSTAPFTPPESIHLTPPSSPEVPFAHFLQHNSEPDPQYPFPLDEFQSYQFYPGSPISHLISPRSVISRSGASSPLPDSDFASSFSLFSNFPVDCPPKLLNLEKQSTSDWRPQQYFDSSPLNTMEFKSNDAFDLNPQTSEFTSDQAATNDCPNTQILVNGSQKDEPADNHRFSFDVSDEDAFRSVGNKPPESGKLAVASPADEGFGNTKESSSADNGTSINTEQSTADGEARQHQKHHSLSLGCVKEFNFDNVDGSDSLKPKINSGWWGQ